MFSRDSTDTLAEAIALLTDALALLDASCAPADIGAHLDLAIHKACNALQSIGVISELATANEDAKISALPAAASGKNVWSDGNDAPLRSFPARVMDQALTAKEQTLLSTLPGH